MEQSKEFHVKYRPSRLSEIKGQAGLVTALQGLTKVGAIPHALLLQGPSGVGKSTTAYIIANELNIDTPDVITIDCATSGGIDSIREIMAASMVRGFGGERRMLILDEAHQISRQGQNSLLLDLERLPDHLYVVLCTTDGAKIIKAVQTRCQTYTLRPLNQNTLLDLLESIREAEHLTISNEHLGMIARNSDGSARQAVVNLSQCAHVSDTKQISDLLDTAEGTSDVIELCRHLLKGYSDRGFAQALALVKKMDSPNAEGIKIVALSYLTAVCLGGHCDAAWVTHTLRCFTQVQIRPADKLAPLVVILADVYEVGAE